MVKDEKSSSMQAATECNCKGRFEEMKVKEGKRLKIRDGKKTMKVKAVENSRKITNEPRKSRIYVDLSL